MVGCGNAPFSSDIMFKGGHQNIINIDISDVVIEQQKKLFPQQQWLVMDVLDLKFEDNAFTLAIDKSLIDTLLCYSDSGKCCSQMIDELYRVLAPGSRYITFSLHSIDEAEIHFIKEKYNWKVSSYLVKSSRWNENEDRHRAVCYTMIVCDKPRKDGSYYNNQTYPMGLEGTLSQEEYIKLRDYAIEVNKKAAIKSASLKRLKRGLHKALTTIANENKKTPEKAVENIST